MTTEDRKTIRTLADDAARAAIQMHALRLPHYFEADGAKRYAAARERLADALGSITRICEEQS